MDTSKIVVSSIRAGMKREFAYLMKAQTEMRELPAGRRVTRSQSVGDSSRGCVVRNSKINKKMKESASNKKLKRNEEEKWERKDVGKLESVNVSNGNNGAVSIVVDVVSIMDNCSRNLEADLVAVTGNKTEKGGADSRECIVRSLCTDSLVASVGDIARLSTHEDSRILSRASDLGCESSGKGTCMMLEKPQRRFTRSVLKLQDGDMELGSSAGAVETFTTSPSKLEGLSTNEDIRILSGASDLGCESSGEGTCMMLEKPQRRFTRSVLKLRDGDMELGSSAGDVETLTTSPSKLERLSTHEDSRILSGASDLGCESSGEGTCMMLEKPQRRFTRSALKLRDGSMELGSSAGAVETLTTSPSKLEGLSAHEDSRILSGASDLRCESSGEGTCMMLEKPRRRFTRSVLKLQDGDIELGSSAGALETLTTSPLKLEGCSTHEDSRQFSMASHLGCDSSREGTCMMLEKPQKRFTRSVLKLQDGDMELGSSAGAMETFTTSPSKLEQLSTHEDSRILSGASVLGCESSGEGTCMVIEKPQRRFTRSVLKLRDGSMELGSSAGAVETLTTSPLKLEGFSTHEDSRILSGASDLGCESSGEGTCMMLEKPQRRFTRSVLKLLDGDMELGSSAGTVETLTTSPSKLEMKMSKKIGLKRIPVRLKGLLETGLLENLHVRYVNRLKGRRQQAESELQGVIKGTGVLCLCDECEGKKVVTPNQFELHAHSSNKRPPEYIYLENGKNLRDVLNACKANLSDSLEAVIQNAIGRSNYTTNFCINCSGLIPEAGAGRAMLLCDSCVLPKESDPSQTQNNDSCVLPKEFDHSQTQNADCCVLPTESSQSQTHNNDSCALPKESSPNQPLNNDVAHRTPLVGSSIPVSPSCPPEVLDGVKISSSSQPQVKSQGKLTRKDLRLHKSVLAEDLLPDGTALSYVMHGKIILEGYKKDGAILCFCCNKVVSPSQFEAHAGFASRRKPYMSIYTSNGVSLHQLSLELSRCRQPSTEENDDLCSICKDGGNLLCCENCPRAFHTECVDLSSTPQGAWYCKYCQNMFEKEKFSEHNANAIAAGRVPGVNPLEDITRRCIRIVANVEKYIGGGCVICRVDQFSKSGFNDHTVMICDQCEREYHVKCLREQQMDDLKTLPETEWFCRKECSCIHSFLQKLIGNGEQRLPEAVLNILEKKCDGGGSQQDPKPDVRWRLLRGKEASEDTRAWLSGAVTIFHERFDPIADASTHLDLVPTMVYGRKFKDQEFYGMYCAILTVDSAVVSAAIVRVFGEEVAELPLVATRSDCQGKGYFQALFVCIEDLLSSLNVKNLVLPAADEAESLWKNRFGFEKLGQEQLDEYKKSYQLMIFQGTSVLHKSISKS